MEKKIKQFEDLPVWKNATALAVQIYRISEIGKLKNDFGAKDQIRRAACSISNNIAEGFEYNNNRIFLRFLNYSKGSAGEVRNQIFILKEINYIDKETYKSLYDQVCDLSKQISNFMKYLKVYNEKSKIN
jgi:four helix bundle protein